MKFLTVFAIGLLFGLGLIVSGMTDPAVVLAFLDLAGDWNPALAFVMGGALLAAAPAYAYVRRGGRALDGAAVTLPDRFTITPDLVLGSAIFGVGWGLSGFCPGPALVAGATGHPLVLIFLVSMAAGIWAQRRRSPPSTARAADRGELSCG